MTGRRLDLGRSPRSARPPGQSLYLLGSEPGVPAEAAAAPASAGTRGCDVAGTHHGYFEIGSRARRARRRGHQRAPARHRAGRAWARPSRSSGSQRNADRLDADVLWTVGRAVRLRLGPRAAGAGLVGRQWPGMDLPTRDRAAAHVAPLPAGQPGLPQPGDGAGKRAARMRAEARGRAPPSPLPPRWRRSALRWTGNAVGRGARAGAAGGGGGGAAALRRRRAGADAAAAAGRAAPPRAAVGRCRSARARSRSRMTVLGFAHVPFNVSLADRDRGRRVRGRLALRRCRRARACPAGAVCAWPAYLAVLLAAVSLIPLFRAGFVTVEGKGRTPTWPSAPRSSCRSTRPRRSRSGAGRPGAGWYGAPSRRSTTRWRRSRR